LDSARAARVARLQVELCPTSPPARKTEAFRWSVKIDRIGFVDRFEASDWSNVEELVIDIARDHPAHLTERLEHLAGVLGRDRIRLALPALTRKWEEHGLLLKVQKLRAAGWRKWEAANLSAWSHLGLDPSTGTGDLDLATDWSVYVINRAAARQL